jgi:hypothetical protein
MLIVNPNVVNPIDSLVTPVIEAHQSGHMNRDTRQWCVQTLKGLPIHDMLRFSHEVSMQVRPRFSR